MKLVEKDEVLQDNDLIAKKLYEVLKNAVSALNITDFTQVFFRYKKASKKPRCFFLFKTVKMGDIEKEINNINPKKATTNNTILPKNLKKSSKVSVSLLRELFND